MQARLAHRRVRSILEQWFREYPPDRLPFEPLPGYTEIAFQVPVAPAVTYCGRIDLLARMKVSGSLVVVDFKTTRRLSPSWLRKWELDTQVSGYIYAAKQHTNLPVIGMTLVCIELPDPLDPTRKCKKHGVLQAECSLLHVGFEIKGPIIRTDQQLESWRMTIAQIAEKYRCLHLFSKEDMAFIPQEGMFATIAYTNACNQCRLWTYCKDGRPAGETMTNYLKYDPWWCMPQEEGATE